MNYDGIERDIKDMISKELKSANSKFPKFNSDHEAIAVICEEVEELSSDLENMGNHINDIWEDIKMDAVSHDTENFWITGIKMAAINSIKELVQIAAMSDKWQNMDDTKPKSYDDLRIGQAVTVRDIYNHYICGSIIEITKSSINIRINSYTTKCYHKSCIIAKGE